MIDWRHWHNEPFLIGGLIFLGWLYAVLTGPLRPRLACRAEALAEAGRTDEPYPRRHAIKFYSALVLFYLAVGSPLDQIAERFLFSAHMLQHQIMIYPAAMLFLHGLPEWLVRPLATRPVLRPLLRLLTHPIVCGLVYVLVMSLWHFPLLYEWALQNRPVHIAEHCTMFGAALLLWWPLYSPSREFPPLSYPWQMLYLFLIMIGMTPVFAYLTFSPDLLYPTYEYAPRLLARFSPADDQLLAGVMMKLVGFCVFLGAFGVSFYRWYQASDKTPR